MIEKKPIICKMPSLSNKPSRKAQKPINAMNRPMTEIMRLLDLLSMMTTISLYRFISRILDQPKRSYMTR